MKRSFIFLVTFIILFIGQLSVADSGGGWTGNEKEGANVLRQLNPGKVGSMMKHGDSISGETLMVDRFGLAGKTFQVAETLFFPG